MSAARTRSACSAGARTATVWLVPLLGKAAVSRSYACMAAVVRGTSSGPGNFSFMPSAGAASASSSATEISSVATGARSAGLSTAGQNRGRAGSTVGAAR